MSMSPRLRIDPTLPTPIWAQVEDAVHRLVASGTLEPGAALPSVRDLARELRINPNTAAKAYQRLAETGVLETRRGEGTFVARRPPTLSAAVRGRLLREGAERYCALAVTLGASEPEARSALGAAWPATEPGSLR
jgi:GntR family transcriptional regulator